ncbi:hypothetical protein PGB90_008541 [Kerria lacca]
MGNFSKLLPNDSLPKWQVALIISVPVAFGLGYLYYKSNLGNKALIISSNVNNEKEKAKVSSQNSQSTKPVEVVSVTTQADNLKNQGNVCFKSGNYTEAVFFYSEALKICPDDNKQKSTYYQNRAAAYEKLGDFEKVLEDCTEALNLNKQYVKAMLRRAKAAEKLKNIDLALEDTATACILEGFRNTNILSELDRLGKLSASRDVDEYNAKHIPKLPSRFFIKTYISTYQHGSVINKELITDETAMSLFKKYKSIEESLFNCGHIENECDELMKECEEAGHELIKLETQLLRATYYILSKQNSKAFEDLDAIITKENIDTRLKINALIKRGTLHQHQGNADKREEDFNKAIEIDENNPDIYHHLGQIYLILDNTSESVDNFRKAIALDPEFPITVIQHCYAEYKYAIAERNTENMLHYLKEFKQILKKFPDNIDCITLYAQVLTERQEYSEAERLFNEAIQREPEHAALLVHKALLVLQWKAEVEQAKQLIHQALELDIECEFAYETIATIEMQLGNLGKGVEYFNEAIKRFTSIEELFHLFCLRNTSLAQMKAEERVAR